MERNPVEADPNRFEVARKTLLFDRVMTVVIITGGLAVIGAVFGIFVFILSQILPLFSSAEVEERGSVDLGLKGAVLLGVDEWGELPFVMTEDGQLVFIDLRSDPETRRIVLDESGSLAVGSRGVFEVPTGLPEGIEWSRVRYDPYSGTILLGSADGRLATVGVAYTPDFAGGTRTIRETVTSEAPFRIAGVEGRVLDLDYYSTSEGRLIGAIIDVEGSRRAVLQPISLKKPLIGPPKMTPADPIDLTDRIEGTPRMIRTGGSAGERLIIGTEEGVLYFFTVRGSELILMQRFEPFGDREAKEIATLDWLFGRASLVTTNAEGANRVFGSFLDQELGKLQYTRIKEFPELQGVRTYSHSLRNRAFILGTESTLSLRYSTTEVVRWSDEVDYEVEIAALGPKYDSIFVYDSTGKLHVLELDDPHPEAGFQAFFGKIWYEGQPEPDFQWQSTGGSSSFEPKLSIVPLFFGSLKGTLYAMVFSVPIAILAAVYTSQFMTPALRRIVKPTMEVMASLPSVVLGFLAALWLAPILYDRVPSVLCILFLIPTVSIACGMLWGRVPQSVRMHLRPGNEFYVMVPVVLVVGYVGWHLGPLVEHVLFGGDFKSWWPQVTGANYEQRNSLVVGFMMGFTVIPLIFTISEDALSNVPPYLTSASLALGASRWQTTWMVVIPTGSPGIFSALMIGLGRAVGETMIVVMATGNTAVMEWNIFNGMRTLAANIAVELPEAPQHSTLYRTLFLGAMVLFVLTFLVNTVAEVTRQRLREKYKTV